MRKQVLNPPTVPAPAGNYSHLVRLEVGVRVRYLPAEPPASTLVEVSRLIRPGLMVEVDVVAAVPR